MSKISKIKFLALILAIFVLALAGCREFTSQTFVEVYGPEGNLMGTFEAQSEPDIDYDAQKVTFTTVQGEEKQLILACVKVYDQITYTDNGETTRVDRDLTPPADIDLN